MELRLATGLLVYIGLSIYAVFYLRACLIEYHAARASFSPSETFDLLHRFGSRFASFALTIYFDQLNGASDLRTMERLRNISTEHSRLGIAFFLAGPVAGLFLIFVAVMENPTTSGYLILGYCAMLLITVVLQTAMFNRKLMLEYVGAKNSAKIK